MRFGAKKREGLLEGNEGSRLRPMTESYILG
jgi:hypothetical protein